MADFDLLNLDETKINSSMEGKIVLFYSTNNCGKTKVASQIYPHKTLILATEKGYMSSFLGGLFKPNDFVTYKELIRAINYYKEYVDGIIIISAFPCGPDSIVNDLIIRNTKDIPIINLIIDEVSSNTGILTRLESFMDIINKESAYGK